jgi:hypothetical protein
MTPTVVVTSINPPTEAMQALARQSMASDHNFIVIGDAKSPADFHLEGCRFLRLDEQYETGFLLAEICPKNHYARKNIGYLLAIHEQAGLIIDTDDDNLPRDGFFEPRQRVVRVGAVDANNWINVYAYFTTAKIWPRGLPLDAVDNVWQSYEQLVIEELDCPIQQGLADENPDVDAIYRLILPLPQSFLKDRQVALKAGSWCPFNSQNTTWWPDAYPLLFLPAYCSFRMTDIWRSFVAQRIAWENGWCVLFHEPTVWQDRNPHDLMRDFADEVPGYLNNRNIAQQLGALSIQEGPDNIPDNMRLCYEQLVRMALIGSEELELLEAWLADLASAPEQ